LYKLLHAEENLLLYYVHIAHNIKLGELMRRRRLMANRDHFRESATELPTPLSVLYSVVDDAQRYDAYLENNPRGNYDHELADFLLELLDEPAGGPSAPGLCLPSGWPTGEFSSALARKACPTS
jgi:hypothetical protein